MNTTNFQKLFLLAFCIVFFSACGENEQTDVQKVSYERLPPQYGGTINVATQFTALNPLSFNAYDWVWKTNHDQPYLDHLIMGDLEKGPRGTNENDWNALDYVPAKHSRGDLAESWSVEQNPLRLVFKIRPGVYWPGRDGVMERRELVADDVVFFYQHKVQSPRYIPTFWDFVKEWKAEDKYTVVAYLKSWNANWAYRIAWGWHDAIPPPEVLKLNNGKGSDDWRVKTGTGPFQVVDIKPDDVQVYEKNNDYWDKEIIKGQEYKLPYADRIIYHIMPDEAAQIAAIRTCKIDLIERFRWQFAEELKRSAPDLIVKKTLHGTATFIALRNDKPPFDDIKVRRAMNLAVDQQEIVATLMNGEGEILDYPFSADWKGLHTPIQDLPDEGRELFTYDPEKAKQLLVDAGYPKGFEFDLMFTTANVYHMDLMAMLEAYYKRIGVTMNPVPLDYPTFRAKMRATDQALGYLMDNSKGNPFAVLRKSFVTGQTWNPAMHSDPEFDKKYFETLQIQDDELREQQLKELNVYIISEKAPHVWLPTIMAYQAWWPYVKNYWGETAVGAARAAPIYARIWIDQDMKKKMGCFVQ